MSYVDLTSYAQTNKRFDWQDLNSFAANDAYKHLPAGTTWLFFQAVAPTGWARVANGHNNKALRVVDGGGAGGVDGGGANLLGSTITLAHSHTTPGHTHSWSHSHTLNTQSSLGGQVPDSSTASLSSADTDGAALVQDAGSGTGRSSFKNTFKFTLPSIASASPGTDSQLTDVNPKYFDAQLCVKS